mmetsp:Transcript_53136/g.119256  ORF Transcript_53136/g.119256 Transcript_53136/m.119256 type:complete len:225 (+) Transcript_53136:494-1168(+)
MVRVGRRLASFLSRVSARRASLTLRLRSLSLLSAPTTSLDERPSRSAVRIFTLMSDESCPLTASRSSQAACFLAEAPRVKTPNSPRVQKGSVQMARKRRRSRSLHLTDCSILGSTTMWKSMSPLTSWLPSAPSGGVPFVIMLAIRSLSPAASAPLNTEMRPRVARTAIAAGSEAIASFMRSHTFVALINSMPRWIKSSVESSSCTMKRSLTGSCSVPVVLQSEW